MKNNWRPTFFLLFLLTFNTSFAQFNERIIFNCEDCFPSRAFSADLDADGDIDVLHFHINERTLRWLENDGNGNFSDPNIISTDFLNVRNILIFDFDIDGDNDILYNISNRDTLTWFKNDGKGNFSDPTSIFTLPDGNIFNIFTTDFDTDGDKDLCFLIESDRVVWYKNNGNGNYAEEPIIALQEFGALTLQQVDLDLDGDIDLLSNSLGEAASQSQTDCVIAWYENDGNGFFSDKKIIASAWNGRGVGSSNMVATNLDSNKDVEILWSYYISNDIPTCYEDGQNDRPVFQKHRVTVLKNEAIDGLSFDQIEDLPFTCSRSPFVLSAADFDNDGDNDILHSTENIMGWLENNGNGNFSDLDSISTKKASILSVSDLDKDNDIDLLFTTGEGQIGWLENNLNPPSINTSIPDFSPPPSIKIYPNLFSDFIIIEQENHCIECLTLNLFDATGRQVKAIPLIDAVQTISTTQIDKGFYFYQINRKDDRTILSGKLIRK